MRTLLLRAWIVLLGLLLWSAIGSSEAGAAEFLKRDNFQVELNVSSWFTQGETRWSHNASTVNPRFGNPTSQLTYDDVGTNVVQVGGKVTVAKRFFLRGEYGFGGIGGGRLTDEDHVNGGFSQTQSNISGNGVSYVNVDLGYKLLTFPNQKGSVSVFLGYQYWREAQEARGVTQTACTAVGTLCRAVGTVTNSGQVVINNTTTWNSFRIGIESGYRFTSRFSLDGKVAFIPYTSLQNNDIHHLRTDLQQNPSISLTGTGIGVNAEANASYRVFRQLFFDVGYRFFWLNVLDGQFQDHPVSGSSSTVPLNEFRSARYGMTVGLHYDF